MSSNNSAEFVYPDADAGHEKKYHSHKSGDAADNLNGRQQPPMASVHAPGQIGSCKKRRVHSSYETFGKRDVNLKNSCQPLVNNTE